MRREQLTRRANATHVAGSARPLSRVRGVPRELTGRTRMNTHRCFVALVFGVVSSVATAAHAQSASPAARWSAEFGAGWDNSVSGNINSSAIGTLNNQAVVVLKNRYEDVYGTGLHLRFGGGYMLDDITEIKGVFTFQSLDADLTPMGDLGVSRLYAQYDDYQSLGLDLGVRRYIVVPTDTLRPYADGTVGIAFVDKTTIELVAPQANLIRNVTDYYDKTAAFTFGINGGVLWQFDDRVGLFGQVGLRYVTGMSEVDQFLGTGLETINDKTSRWTMPFVIGARARF
jgi:hypothetical protein